MSKSKQGCFRLEFLYIKQVSRDDVNRTYRFTCLLHPDMAAAPDDQLAYSKARDRLLRLFAQDGDRTSESIPENVQSFSAAMISLPGWQNENAFILTRDHPVFTEDMLRHRVQVCQSCAYLTSAMISDYTRLIYDTPPETSMINLISLIRTEFTSTQLEEYIFIDKRLSGSLLLKTCLEAGTRLKRVRLNQITRDLLVKIGPGIISSFRIHQDYNDAGKLSFTGEPGALTNPVRRHAMLILGVRTETVAEQESQIFFVQNWNKKGNLSRFMQTICSKQMRKFTSFTQISSQR